ncbi:hypothetical protein DY000_02026341 [Brassica cretica]|uniref:Thioredoxin domain-containing protein n=1 Tax=Brassica cretica TaxID=69181 RepID=A0ABQ7E5C4_BRACR|nr:hypothetical protein DY000_02026341 [Brassica cretica]
MDAISPLRAVCGIGAQNSGTRIDHGLSGNIPWLETKHSPLCLLLPMWFLQRHSPIGMSKGMRWWEKSTKENMLEIHSTNHLVDSLLKAGDRLVVLDFYSPGCGGCKSLHPKICQLAESIPNVMFLKVNQKSLEQCAMALTFMCFLSLSSIEEQRANYVVSAAPSPPSISSRKLWRSTVARGAASGQPKVKTVRSSWL